jgi:DNA transformation protein and related proteins
MNDLTTLPNLGKVLVKQLETVGISSESQLKTVGAEEAFARLATLDDSACINMLYALEGAIQGIRWHQLPTERKRELLEFFHFCKKQTKQRVKTQ